MPDFGRWTGNGGDPSLNEINRADQFFEALASSQPVYSTDREEAELAFLLAGWRDDVREAPVTTPVSTGAAADALRAGLSGRGARRSFAIVGSVAAAVLCIGGFGTAVYGSGPGDSLYGMRSAIFGQAEATRDEQVSLASAQLAQVQQLIDSGQWQQAQDKLVAVSTAVQGVGPVDQKQQLVEQWNALTYKVVEQDPAATLPSGQPLPPLPSSPLTWLPVPTADATPSSSTSTTSSTATTSTTSSTSTTSETPTSETSPTSPTDTTGPSNSSATTAPSSPSTPTSASSSVTPTTSPAAVTPPPTSATTSAPAVTSTTTAPASSTATTATREPQISQQPSTSAAAPAPSPREQPSSPTQPAERPVATPTTTTVLPAS